MVFIPTIPFWFSRRAESEQWDMVGGVISGSSRTAGISQFDDFSSGPIWRASISDLQLLGAEDVLLWRAIRRIADGGSGQLIVHRNEIPFAPYPQGLSTYSVPYSDGSHYSDGSQHYQPVITAYTVTNFVFAGLKQLRFDLLQGGPLVGGEVFSIDHPVEGWRMYEISDYSQLTATEYLITIEPPLRGNTPIGTPLEFDQPRCVMRAMEIASFDLVIEQFPYGKPSMSLIESFIG